jgi:3,4-dihydroxy 2-butanone 4-phosphate synthase/GTP cyclohydrolase II
MTVESLVRQDMADASGPSTDALHPAIVDLALGNTVVLVTKCRAALVFPAATASASQTAFCIRHTSGFLEVALPSRVCDRLLIPEAVAFDQSDKRCARQCVAVDAVGGTTGISAVDRARTARTLARPDATHLDVTRPGHVVVVKVDEPFAATSVPHAAMFLCELATGNPAAVFAELVSPADQRQMATGHEGIKFADFFGLQRISL